jgi:hypothetical protein
LNWFSSVKVEQVLLGLLKFDRFSQFFIFAMTKTCRRSRRLCYQIKIPDRIINYSYPNHYVIKQWIHSHM